MTALARATESEILAALRQGGNELLRRFRLGENMTDRERRLAQDVYWYQVYLKACYGEELPALHKNLHRGFCDNLSDIPVRS